MAAMIYCIVEELNPFGKNSSEKEAPPDNKMEKYVTYPFHI